MCCIFNQQAQTSSKFKPIKSDEGEESVAPGGTLAPCPRRQEADLRTGRQELVRSTHPFHSQVAKLTMGNACLQPDSELLACREQELSPGH